ncbi:MAG TPA: serine/threonine-protein kinase, partial [Opitutales bacterium]|nr:serine/threonine-protein kinase [Opitutales bacterium]
MPGEGIHPEKTLVSFNPGQKLFSRYTLIRILGRGGMGVVWLARDEDLDQELAMKFLPDLVLMDKAALEDLKRETRRSRLLTHKNIVRIHDLVRNEQSGAISMEYVDGDTLSNLRMSRPGCVMSAEEIGLWMPSFLDALDYAHNGAHVIHRDIKPANIMLTGRGELKIADFGIASSVSDSVSRVSTQVSSSGTPVYMSPQQMMGERPLPSDDIYSVGATLYELFTSRPPFFTGNIVVQVQNKIPPSMSERLAELDIRDAKPIPAVWEHAVAACLSKDSAARPQSVGELAAMLGIGDLHSFRTPTNAFQKTPHQATQPTILVSQSDAAGSPASRQKTATPIEKPAASAISLKLSKRWLATGAIAAALVLVVWQSDMIARIQADRAYKNYSRLPADASNLQRISSLRQASLLRPGVRNYGETYEQVQSRYIDDMREKVATLDPSEAFRLVNGESEIMVPVLDKAHQSRFADVFLAGQRKARTWVQQTLSAAEADSAGGDFSSAAAKLDLIREFQELLPDFDQAVDRVYSAQVRWGIASANGLAARRDYDRALEQMASVATHAALVPEYPEILARLRAEQVRYEIDQAMKVGAGNEFDKALSMLGRTATRNVLPEDVESARRQLTGNAQSYYVSHLADSILRGDTKGAQTMMDNLAALTGRKFSTNASAINATSQLKPFIAALEEIGIRESGTTGSRHLDVALVRAIRNRFENPKEVRAWLAGEYDT